jgi:uncharacterized protein YkwD
MNAVTAGAIVGLCMWGTTGGETRKQAAETVKVVPAPQHQPAMHPIEAQLLQRTNAERARYGSPPLRLDHSLLRSARQHAIWMTRTRSVQHTQLSVAENIAMGQHSAAQVIRDWMNSPGHRSNLLNPSYTRIGVAAYRTKDGTTFWCQQFLR